MSLGKGLDDLIEGGILGMVYCLYKRRNMGDRS